MYIPQINFSVSIALSFNVTLNAVTHEVSLLSQCNIWDETVPVWTLISLLVLFQVWQVCPTVHAALNLPLRLT